MYCARDSASLPPSIAELRVHRTLVFACISRVDPHLVEIVSRTRARCRIGRDAFVECAI